MFYSGLFLGLAVSSIAVLFFVLWMVFGGKTLALAANAQPAAPIADNQPSADQPPAAPAGPVKPVDEKKDHIIGPKNAKVTLIEYSDFECPFCGKHDPTLKQVLSEYPKDVRLVYRHYPLPFHPNAEKAAEAAECAAKLGGNDAFWKMHDKLFEKSRAQQLAPEVYVPLAKEIGLSEGKFKACLDSGETKKAIDQDAAEGGAAGVEGTPATFVNGKLVSGAQPFPNFKQEIDSALKK